MQYTISGNARNCLVWFLDPGEIKCKAFISRGTGSGNQTSNCPACASAIIIVARLYAFVIKVNIKIRLNFIIIVRATRALKLASARCD